MAQGNEYETKSAPHVGGYNTAVPNTADGFPTPEQIFARLYPSSDVVGDNPMVLAGDRDPDDLSSIPAAQDTDPDDL